MQRRQRPHQNAFLAWSRTRISSEDGMLHNRPQGLQGERSCETLQLTQRRAAPLFCYVAQARFEIGHHGQTVLLLLCERGPALEQQGLAALPRCRCHPVSALRPADDSSYAVNVVPIWFPTSGRLGCHVPDSLRAARERSHGSVEQQLHKGPFIRG